MKFRVIHVDGSKKGQTENFDVEKLTIGRDPSNVLAFDPHKDDRVSTRHAEIAVQGGAVVLTDMNSRNGTFVGGSKIQGTVPLTTGALVQFGEKGPMITIHFEGAPAAAAAGGAPAQGAAGAAPGKAPAAGAAPGKAAAAGAAPAVAVPKKGGGCSPCAMIMTLLMFLLVAGAIAAAVFFFMRKNKEGEHPDVVMNGTTNAVPPDTTTPVATPKVEPTSKVEQPKSTPAPKETYESPWKKIKVGTVFELESKMQMPSMPDGMTSKSRWTLLSIDDKNAKVRMETLGADGNPMAGVPANDVDMPLKSEAVATETPKPLEKKNETIETPAGKFSCEYTKTESKTNDVVSVTESWMNKDLPVPVKSITKSGDTRIEMTLVKLDKK